MLDCSGGDPLHDDFFYLPLYSSPPHIPQFPRPFSLPTTLSPPPPDVFRLPDRNPNAPLRQEIQVGLYMCPLLPIEMSSIFRDHAFSLTNGLLPTMQIHYLQPEIYFLVYKLFWPSIIKVVGVLGLNSYEVCPC